MVAKLVKVCYVIRLMTGSELRQLRQSLNLSQREFAQILGVTRVTVTNAENKRPSKALVAYVDQALAAGRLKRREQVVSIVLTAGTPQPIEAPQAEPQTDPKSGPGKGKRKKR